MGSSLVGETAAGIDGTEAELVACVRGSAVTPLIVVVVLKPMAAGEDEDDVDVELAAVRVEDDELKVDVKLAVVRALVTVLMRLLRLLPRLLVSEMMEVTAEVVVFGNATWRLNFSFLPEFEQSENCGSQEFEQSLDDELHVPSDLESLATVKAM